MLTVNASPELFRCGVATTAGISRTGSSPEAIIKGLLASKQVAFFVMADAQAVTRDADAKNTPGVKLKEYIEKHDLGPIVESEGWHFNEAHGPQYIKIYVWRPDREGDGMKKWLEGKEVKVAQNMSNFK